MHLMNCMREVYVGTKDIELFQVFAIFIAIVDYLLL